MSILHKKDAYEIKVVLSVIQDQLSNWRVITKQVEQCNEIEQKLKIDQIWRSKQDCIEEVQVQVNIVLTEDKVLRHLNQWIKD